MANYPLEIDPSLRRSAEEIVSAFSSQFSGIRPDFYLKDRPDGPYLVIELASPSEHHFKILNLPYSVEMKN